MRKKRVAYKIRVIILIGGYKLQLLQMKSYRFN